MKSAKIEPVPGVYQNGVHTRTLLVVTNGKCVYGHGTPAEGPWPVTSCSIRTFVKRVGAIPTRRLTVDEAISLAERLEPYNSRRRSNRWERTMFHTTEGRSMILAALAPDSACHVRESSAPAADGGTVIAAATEGKERKAAAGFFRRLVRLWSFGRHNGAQVIAMSVPTPGTTSAPEDTSNPAIVKS